VLKESYLEEISNILNSGEISNIMNQEDNDEIFTDLKQLVKEKSMVETRENIFTFFSQNVRQNLHIVLAFSPVGSKLRNRLRQVCFVYISIRR